MDRTLLHVYRNTALGRETLLQSAFFCAQTGCELNVYVPRHPEFLMYFESGVATINLDSSFTREPDVARARVNAIAGEFDVQLVFLEPEDFTAPTLPSVSAEHTFMTCPRTMSELSSKIGFGHLGPRVRAIVQKAAFPVLLPTPVFKPWRSITACFGGSDNSIRALFYARRLSELAGVPLAIFTWAENQERAYYEEPLEQAGLLEAVRAGEVAWLLAADAPLAESLFQIGRDDLVVAGAYGRGAVREALFGSKLEVIQTEVPNNLLVVGPQVQQRQSKGPTAFLL